jgi:superfamily II DNA or RNA helicase
MSGVAPVLLGGRRGICYAQAIMLRSTEVFGVYQAASDAHRSLAQAVVLFADDLPLPAALEAIQASPLGRRFFSDNPASPELLRSEIEQLVSQGLLQEEKAGSVRIRPHPALIHWALQEALERGVLADIHHRAVHAASIDDPSGGGASHPLRLRVGLYLKEQGDEFLELISRSQEPWPLSRILGSAAPASFFEALSPRVRDVLIPGVLTSGLKRLHPVAPGLLAYLSEAGSQEMDRDLRWLSLFVAGLQDDFPRALSLSVGDGSSDEALQLALLAMMQGHFDAARARLVDGLHKASSDPAQGPWRISSGPFLALLMLTSSVGAEAEMVTRAVTLGTRGKGLGDRQAYAWLQLLQQVLASGDVAAERLSKLPADTWMAQLVAGWVHIWVKTPMSTGRRREVESTIARAEQSEWTWLVNAMNASLQDEPARRPIASDWSGLYERRPAWQLKLSGLAGLASEIQEPGTLESPWLLDEAVSDTDDQRVAWWVTLHDGRMEIEPRHQRRTPAGWTPGRRVAARNLEHPGEELKALLTEADRRVLGHLRREVRVLSEGIEFDRRVGEALIGHPRVFLKDGGPDPIRVLPGTVVLRVLALDAAMRVQVVPGALAKQEVYAERADGGLRVFAVNEALMPLIAVIGASGFDVPLEAEKTLLETLSLVARHLPVHSEIALGPDDVRVCASDSRVYVQLSRSGAGLRYRLRVFPLGPAGPAYPPGEGPVHLVAPVESLRLKTSRDPDEEWRIAEMVQASCPTMQQAVPAGGSFALENLVSCLELLTELQALGPEVVMSWPEGVPLKVLAPRDVSDLKVSVGGKGKNWLELTGGLQIDESGRLLDLQTLLSLNRSANGRFVTLENGDILALTRELQARLQALEALDGGPGQTLALPALAASFLEGWVQGIEDLQLDDAASHCLQRLKESESLSIEVPIGLRSILRDYQKEGFEWMMRLAHWGAGACLADDMGLGKTIQTLAVLISRRSLGPSLVVAPASVLANWESETERFAPALTVRRIASAKQLEESPVPEPGQLVLLSYALLPRVVDVWSEVRFATLVLDEAHAIKNASTQRAKAVKKLESRFRIALTGTPVENHILELFSLFAFINPGLLGSEKAFRRKYTQENPDAGSKNLDGLKMRLSPFVLRRTKDAVLKELPPKTEIVLRVELSETERAFYEAIRQEAIGLAAKASDPAAKNMQLLASLTRLRRAVCHPRLVSKDAPDVSTKLDTTLELLDELIDEGHRVLVFSQFVDHLRIVSAALESRRISFQYLDGGTSLKKRQKAIDDFQAGKGDVFLISLKAGGLGINLTGADYVIHLDPWWNPAAEDQASDRAHRLGQTRPVTIYKLVAQGTVEDRIVRLHEEKRAMVEAVLSGTDQAKALDAHALEALLAY